jgi:hypothetical protein
MKRRSMKKWWRRMGSKMESPQDYLLYRGISK